VSLPVLMLLLLLLGACESRRQMAQAHISHSPPINNTRTLSVLHSLLGKRLVLAGATAIASCPLIASITYRVATLFYGL